MLGFQKGRQDRLAMVRLEWARRLCRKLQNIYGYAGSVILVLMSSKYKVKKKDSLAGVDKARFPIYSY